MISNFAEDARRKVGARMSRVCMLSQREIRKHAAWCSMYEFEDVICEIDDVDRIDLRAGKGFSWQDRAVCSLVWRQISRLSTRLNPGIRPLSVESEYELFVYVCMNPWDLLYLNAVHGWKEKCRKKVCYLFEVWGGIAHRYKHLLELLNQFDHVFMALGSSVDPVRKLVDTPCCHLSLAADTLRFSPYPNPPPRSIDVYSLGRRREGLHKELYEMSRQKEIFYVYDTIADGHIQPANHREHRDLYGNLAKRSRFFIAFPAKVDMEEETQGLSEPGMRFYEGIASGAVLVGQAPRSDIFKKEFDWPDSVISVGNNINHFIEVLKSFKCDPEKFDRLSRTNAGEALRRHDWAHRWKEILRITGQLPGKKLLEREALLNCLAETASKPHKRDAEYQEYRPIINSINGAI
jgi:hypothetical protein